MSNPNSYIIASCKDWHQEAFERFKNHTPGNWAYVSNKKELTDSVNSLAPRYVFFLHWNWLVPSSIFEHHECVCFHMTDLPYGRGGSPLQNLISRGHQDTKLTALRMVQDMDAGPVYCKRSLSLTGKASEIYLRAGDVCWEMIRWIIEKEPTPQPQVGEITIFKRRTPDQSELPQSQSFVELYNFIRMLDAPTYPQAFLQYGNYVLEFSDAILQDQELTATVKFRLHSDRSHEK